MTRGTNSIDPFTQKINNNMKNEKVWYVTGASQGLGLTLVKQLLQDGYRVAATSRNSQALAAAVGNTSSSLFLPLEVDLGDVASIAASVMQTLKFFGRVDVLVNNAGYGMAGTLEETSAEDIAKIIAVNVLSTINVAKVIIPYMREQRSGYIINIGSVAGFVGAPGWAVYAATKAAVAAFTEVLSLDLKEFGIDATVIEPSGFRTGFLTKHSLAYTESKIEGYQAVKDTQARYLAADGKQPGDPEKAAAIMISLAEELHRPVHLYLGQDAFNRAQGKLQQMQAELVAWKEVTLSADFKH